MVDDANLMHHAAATLQAATRAMLRRRRSFAHAKRQAMASLVIQKSLLQWWILRDGSGGVGGVGVGGVGVGGVYGAEDVRQQHQHHATGTAAEGRKRKDR
jgi:uncharacterized protein GlcG (DUF336 family)